MLWFETSKSQATVYIPRASCQAEAGVAQLQYQYLWQKLVNVSTIKFYSLVDS